MQRGFLKVPVQHLSDEPTAVTLRCPATSIGLEGFLGDVVVDATVRRVDQRILLTCTIQATAEGTCDRCAEPFTRELSTRYEQWYVIDGHPGTIEEEAYAIAPEQSEIVVDTDVRELTLVALPMQLLCKDDCLGLCPTCGRNRNLDPCTCASEEEHPLWSGLKDMTT